MMNAGQRLGPYEIIAPLGVGGMGEVYRARDTKLNRDVAIKVLLPSVANDPDRLARFSREAQVLASLNHPNIAAIYGIEETSGVTALVMELVDGEDLSQRITRGAIPIDEALPIARQIAEALEAAHDHGIIHRDLKPANIKVRPDGTVKVLDFGLAKAVDPTAGSSATAMNSPTLSIHATQAGIILGTAAYMSPEQAAGKSVDKRSDLWAFGVVLFEILSGRQMYSGESVSHVLAAVLKDHPDWSALPIDTPAPIRRLLRRCLEKERRRRMADAADVRLEIDDALASPAEAAERRVADAGAGSTRPLILAWSTALVFAVLTAVLATIATRPGLERELPVTRSIFVLNEQLHVRPPSTRFALSPDGRSLAYAGADSSGPTLLWVRSLDGTAARPIAGTDGAIGPFWSPDSRFIAFNAGGRLMKVAASGGTPITIHQRSEGSSAGSWNGANVIVFNSEMASALTSVSAVGGGTTTPVTTLDAAVGETRHGFPFFLPDQRHFLFVAFKGYLPLGLYVGSLHSKDRRLLLQGASNAQYADGALVFSQGTTLMGQRFDPVAATLLGDAVTIADQVQVNTAPFRAAAFSVSVNGGLLYQPGVAGGNTRMTWSDRTGTRTPALSELGSYRDLWMSPEGGRASVSRQDARDGTSDLWIVNLVRGLRTRFTFDPGDEFVGVWSADGTDIVFNSSRRGRLDLYRRPVGGAGEEELLLADDRDKTPTDWSPDRQSILFMVDDPQTAHDLWVLPLSGNRKPFAFAETSFQERWGQFSPDGRWVAYSSSESGRMEVYVAQFPTGHGRSQISVAGGSFPRWRGDGQEMFYQSLDEKLMAVTLRAQGDRIEVNAAHELFELRNPGGARSFYDVTRDGQRFLHNLADEFTTTPLTLVGNWPGLLRQASH